MKTNSKTGPFVNLRNKLNLLLNLMGNDIVIETKDGHKLCIPNDMEEPGFLMERTVISEKGKATVEEVVSMIGSDVAWMTLIEHAKNMADKEYLTLCGNLTLQKLKKR